MTIRTKWKCHGVLKHVAWGSDEGFLYEAEFTAVTDGSDENKKFYHYTPGGSLKVATYTEDHFTPGVEYYIDITPADAKGD